MSIKLSDVEAGDTLIADDGFTCIPSGPVVIHADEEGRLYFPCSHDEDTRGPPFTQRHYIDGQVDFDDQVTLVGLARP